MNSINFKSEKQIKLKGEKYNQLFYSFEDIDFTVTSHFQDNKNLNLVFIHGLAGSSDIWIDLMHQCYKKYNIYALDLPWNGRKSMNYRDSCFLLKWFSEIINFLNLPSDDTCIIAHSFGATMTLSCLLIHEIGVSKLILCAPTWKNEDGSHIDWKEYKEFIIKFEESIYEFIKLKHSNIKEEIVNIMIDKILQESSPRNTLSFIDCLFNLPNIPPNYRNNISILIIYGKQDEVVSTKHSKYLYKVLPNARLIEYPYSKHYIMLDNTTEFNNDIIKFISK